MGKLAQLKSRIAAVDLRRGASVAVDRIRGRKLDRIRRRVLLRDHYTCRRCGRVSVDLEVDHIVPLFLGGAESDENRQALCRDCHDAKSADEQRDRYADG